MESRDQFKGVFSFNRKGSGLVLTLGAWHQSHLVDSDPLFLRNVGGSDEVYKESEFKRSKAGSRSKTETRKSAGYLD